MKGGKNARWIDEDMAGYFVDKVKGFIKDNRDKPFFLYYGLHEPHVPRVPNGRFVGATGMGRAEMPLLKQTGASENSSRSSAGWIC